MQIRKKEQINNAYRLIIIIKWKFARYVEGLTLNQFFWNFKPEKNA